MRTKSMKLRRCLRCKYGKQVLRNVISRLDMSKGHVYAEDMLKDCPCAKQLMKLCIIMERAWFPDELIDRQYQLHEQTILMDMVTELQLYLDWSTDRKANNGKSMAFNTTSVMSILSSYSGLLCKDWVSSDNADEKRKAEIEKRLSTVKAVIKNFSRITYTKDYLKYRTENIKPKSGEPDVTISPDDCTQLQVPDRAEAALNSFWDFVEMQKRVIRLPKNLQELFWNVYENAPTHFGTNLTAVMEDKSMSANDVYLLVKPYSSNSKMKMSVIQSMMECVYPTSNQNLIPYISRALLVEESVLYTGVGKSWGTFEYQLDTDFLRATEIDPQGKINSIREEVRAGIIAVIKSEEALHEYLQEVHNWENPIYREMYAEETINLCPDRKQRWMLLRERESLLILLSCLEEQCIKNL